MFKQGQQADVTRAFDSLQQSHVAVAGVQLHVIVKDVRNGSAAEKQVDQLLVYTNTRSNLSNQNKTCGEMAALTPV